MITVTHIKPKGYIHSDCFDHVAEALRNAATVIDDPPELEVYIAPHLAHHAGVEIPDGSSIWNFEQVAKSNPWFDRNYRELAERCDVWDYSAANVAAWEDDFGIEAKLLPLGYDPAMSGVIEHRAAKLDVPRFFGSIGKRRTNILNRIDHIRPNGNAYGVILDAFLSRAPCVINFHHYDSAVFEIVRCSYLFANAVPVLSEPSADQGDYAHIPDLFAEVATIEQRCLDRDYPDGEKQRAGYMRGKWLYEHLEEIL